MLRKHRRPLASLVLASPTVSFRFAPGSSSLAARTNLRTEGISLSNTASIYFEIVTIPTYALSKLLPMLLRVRFAHTFLFLVAGGLSLSLAPRARTHYRLLAMLASSLCSCSCAWLRRSGSLLANASPVVHAPRYARVTFTSVAPQAFPHLRGLRPVSVRRSVACKRAPSLSHSSLPRLRRFDNACPDVGIRDVSQC